MCVGPEQPILSSWQAAYAWQFRLCFALFVEASLLTLFLIPTHSFAFLCARCTTQHNTCASDNGVVIVASVGTRAPSRQIDTQIGVTHRTHQCNIKRRQRQKSSHAASAPICDGQVHPALVLPARRRVQPCARRTCQGAQVIMKSLRCGGVACGFSSLAKLRPALTSTCPLCVLLTPAHMHAHDSDIRTCLALLHAHTHLTHMSDAV
jgi:hypothetical protein